MIEASKGLISIQEVTNSLSISERNLSRSFKEIAGITPKYFARVVQLNHAMNAFAVKDEVFLADLAYELGFTDQSHFNKSFRQFMQTNPQDFLEQENGVLLKFLGESR